MLSPSIDVALKQILTAKGSEMEHAIQAHLRQKQEADPTFYGPAQRPLQGDPQGPGRALGKHDGSLQELIQAAL